MKKYREFYRNNFRRGYTLIELVVYMGLLGMLLVILSQFFVAALNVQLVSKADTAVEQDGAYLLARLTYDLRRAATVSQPSLGQTVATFSGIIADSGVNTVYQYSVNDGNMMLAIAGSAVQLNSDESSISNFSLTRIGNSGQSATAKDTLRVGFTVQSKAITSSGAQSLDYQTTVSLR